MKWVDDTHALGVFSSTSLGKEHFVIYVAYFWHSAEGPGYGVSCVQG